MATQAQLAAVQQLYVGYLGRAADSAGQQFWANAIANGTATIASVATGFTLSAEYKAAYGGLTTDALVEKVYNNVLGRTPDAEGKAFWVAALASGKVTADTLVATIVTNLGALDQQTINNKVFVAQTYTDTVGAEYNPTAGANVLVGVDSTPASVTAALETISTGTLPGQVPALNLINAYTAAQDAITAYGKTVASSNAALDANKDGTVTSAEAKTALAAAQDARALTVNGGNKTIATLNADVSNATDALATAKTAATAETSAAVVTAYDNAVTADTAADAAVAANAAATASAQAGLNTSVTASGATVTYATLSTAAGVTGTNVFDSAAKVSAFLADPAQSATARAALVTELNKVTTYGAEVVKAGDLGLAAAKTQVTLTAATTALTDDDASTDGSAYVSAQAALKLANTTLANAKTEDAKVAAVKAVVDQYTALTKVSSDAQDAITKFEGANTDKVTLHDIGNTVVNETGTAAKSDVFFFTSKIASVNDGTIATFGSSDSIVLNSSLKFNSGALTTGDNNVSEFFLVQKGNDVQLVIETAAYGSSDAVTTAASTTDHAAVITLTGVSVADLTVNNGVISHVA